MSDGVPERPAVRNPSPEEVRERFERARQAQASWKRHTLTRRVDALRGFWDELMRSHQKLHAVIRSETGRPVFEVEALEIAPAGFGLKFYTRNAHRILQDTAVPKPWLLANKRAYVRHVPRGAVGLITPYNSPFLIPFDDAFAALLAGNAVVLKPSEWTPQTALFVEERFKASGLFPDGLLQVVFGDGAAGALVAENADMVVFTGSVKAGRRVAKAAAERLVPAVLELGGKHPMIVAEDAPIERAAKAAVWGAFANCGQVCVGVERVYVEEPVYEAFCEAVLRETAALRREGNPYETDLGRLIVPAQLKVMERHLRDAEKKGGKVRGGETLDAVKLLVAPAVVTGATEDMLVMNEETFGPVLPIMPVRRVEEALRLANEGPLGLSASVWTADLSRGEEWSARMEAGMVCVNDLLTHYIVHSLPFGGVKQSGLGRRHGDEGLRMFTHSQSVLVHEWPSFPDLWWFPYSRAKSRLLAWLTRFL